jgi:hypothetical protein
MPQLIVDGHRVAVYLLERPFFLPPFKLRRIVDTLLGDDLRADLAAVGAQRFDAVARGVAP